MAVCTYQEQPRICGCLLVEGGAELLVWLLYIRRWTGESFSGDSLTAFLIFLKKRVKSCRGLILVTKKATKHWSGRCWLGKKSWQQMFKFYIGFMLSGCQQVDHLPCRTENKLREMEFTQKLQFCWDLLTLNLFLLPAWPFFQETNTDIYFNTSWWFVSKFELLFIFY